MKRWLAVGAAALGVSLAGVAAAQSSASPYVFVTVDSVKAEASRLWITGILQGEAAPVQKYVMFSSASYGDAVAQVAACERKALMAMAKPGQYLLAVHDGGSFRVTTCTLTRVNP